MSTDDLPITIPAWGLFAILVIKMVLDWIAARDRKEGAKLAADNGLAAPPTSDEIAAVIRDQAERQEILESLRSSASMQVRVAEALEHVAAAQERIAATQDRQTQLIERQATRTRALAESVASSRQTIDRLVQSVDTLHRDTDTLFTHLGAARPARGESPPR